MGGGGSSASASTKSTKQMAQLRIDKFYHGGNIEELDEAIKMSTTMGDTQRVKNLKEERALFKKVSPKAYYQTNRYGETRNGYMQKTPEQFAHTKAKLLLVIKNKDKY